MRDTDNNSTQNMIHSKKDRLFENCISGGVNKEFLTLKEVAGLLRLTTKTIYKMVGRKQIPYTKVSNRLLFRSKEIEAWLSKRSNHVY